MVRRNLMGLMIGALLLSAVSVAWAGVPDMSRSSATTAASVGASVYSLPNGGGHPVNNCFRLGGQRHNATITLTLLDVNSNPIFQYPWADLWLDTGDGALVYCPAGTSADRDTDVLGQTTWSRNLFAGSSGIGTVILVSGNTLTQAPLNINHNSPDINGSLLVNLSDVTLFAQDIFGGVYRYRSDFYWDGNLNLSDLVLMSQGTGAGCP